jgi:NADH-quinone oxidoreductase subunit L
MPITFGAMTVGLAALAGVPPFSGWFSKDSIIEAAQHSALHGGELGGLVHTSFVVKRGEGFVLGTSEPHTLPGGVAWLVYLGLLATVALTAAYAMRMWLMTFFGETRGSYEVRDPSRVMTWTIEALAVPAAILGFFGLGASELRPHLGASLLSVLLVALGAGAAYLVWNRDPALDPARALGPVRPVFARGFFVDELYAAAIVRPVKALARYVVTFDRIGVDAAVVGTGHGARRLAELFRLPQNGNPQTYLTGLLAGVVVIVAGVVIFL